MTLTTSSRPSAEKQAGGLLLSAWKGGFGPFLRVWVPAISGNQILLW
jgi:hypothetical protein